jgi:hypothetical protein
MDVGEVWRDHTFRMSCLLFAALPLFEAIWATTTNDTHFQSLYSFIGTTTHTPRPPARPHTRTHTRTKRCVWYRRCVQVAAGSPGRALVRGL